MPLLRWLPLAIIVLASFWLRTRDLARRPMHADEANQAVKLGELLETGSYAFDPRDHHGPTLYYAAVPVAWARGERSLATLTETTVRIVPALFGTATVLLVAWLALPLGRWPALAAAAFVGLSPPSVYYSRYFIQETLLVTFTLATLASARRWWETRHPGWAVALGGCVGLMQSTKASAPLFLALALIASAAARALVRGARPDHRASAAPWLRHGLLAAAAALFTAALLYTSFGTNLPGLRDAFGAYTQAFTRFGADAGPTGHEKPWWYYLRMFGWYHEGGLLWHQAAFSALVVAGFVTALVRRERFLVGIAIYAVAVTAAFSLFAYKTPWHAVHFVPAFAVLAAATLRATAQLRTGRLVAVAFTMVTLGTLYQQTARAAFLRPADQRNPYAYVHSSGDVLKFRPIAEAAVLQWPVQPVRVISEEYWPLPWYLRGLSRVGYYSAPPDDCDGALVICSATQADAVRAKLRNRYRETFLGLRPGFICVLFVAEP